MYSTFHQGVFFEKKILDCFVRRIDSRDRIEFRSVAGLKITLIGDGVLV